MHCTVCHAQVYQSCIREFTLHSFLKSHGPLDAFGLERFISNLEVITTARVWGPAEDAAYKDNFLVSLASDGKVGVGVGSGATRQNPWGGSGKPIRVRVEPVCLVVPWAGPEGSKGIAQITRAFLE